MGYPFFNYNGNKFQFIFSYLLHISFFCIIFVLQSEMVGGLELAMTTGEYTPTYLII
jgi:hypothetical protein